MEPISFHRCEQLVVSSDPDILPIPIVVVSYGEEKIEGNFFVSCWKLNFLERLKILFTGKVFLAQLHNCPPAKLTLESKDVALDKVTLDSFPSDPKNNLVMRQDYGN